MTAPAAWPPGILFAGLLAAAGAWLGFDNPIVHEPLAALLYPAGLAWLALTAGSARAAFTRGYWTGAAAGLGCLYWVFVPVHVYGGVHWLLAAPCPVLLAMCLAIYPAAFCLALRWAAPRLPWPLAGLLAGAAWATLEMLCEVLFTGFPWLPLGAALAGRPWAIQGAAWIGSSGVAGMLAAALCWLVMPARGPRPGDTARLALGALVLVSWALFGRVAIRMPSPETATAMVGVAQGNIDQSLKWDQGFRDETVERYIRLSGRLLAMARPELIIWPETAMPFFLQEPTPDAERVRSFADESMTLILTGAPAYKALPGQTGEYASFNRAFLLGPGGMTMGHYDKEHLVPFGEYVPFGDWLPISKLVEGVGDFLPGRDQPPLSAGRLALGMLICYESIFPELAQERVAAGANLLVVISNDAWFGRTSAPWQHLRQSALRAVEQNRWLVRSTNTGVSAFIDPKGLVHAPTALFEAAAISREVGLLDARSFYHRAFAPLRLGTALLAAGLLLAAALRRPPARQG